MQEKDGKHLFGVVKISDKGQIVIPKEARKLYNLQAGDTLMLLGDKNGIAMVKTDVFYDLVGQVMEGLNK
jgi:AbrB family looped-hinge helix DNA binding protein